MADERDYLATYAEAAPDRLAVVEDDVVLDYATFNRRVNRMANVLAGAGVRTADKVLWVGQNSADVVVVVNALRKVKAVGVPMNYRLTAEEAQYVIDNSDSVAVLFDPEQTAQLDGLQDQCPKVKHWLAFRCPPGDQPGWATNLDDRMAVADEGEPVSHGEDGTAGRR
ncbi:MAG TPA: AMP-binding protein [Acidimicrobiales bacterium]